MLDPQVHQTGAQHKNYNTIPNSICFQIASKFSNRMHKSELFIICVFYGQQGYHKFV